MNNQLFKRIGRARPPRSLFNLSYEKKLTADMGQLIPIMCDECVPGDIWDISAAAVVRCQPLVAPPLHQVDLTVHYFFVPYRLIWDDWEDFITGGVTGSLAPALPLWIPDDQTSVDPGSLWDYFGFPPILPTVADTMGPIDFPLRAYNFVWNEYYRDETLMAEITPLNTLQPTPLYRSWEKDYFTSALPWQQRGTAPALPISGVVSATWDDAYFFLDSNGETLKASYYAGDGVVHANSFNGIHGFHDFLEQNQIDLSSATTFDVADLRLAFQIQKWLERNARAGSRYTEQLKAHFDVSPRDDRLDRPEYIGGLKSPIIFSEVLQTSETGTTPQGNLAGHGLSVAGERIGKYRVLEFGLIIGLMSIMPKPAYQQGVNRQWLRRTKTDFYFPEFAHLSEQLITRNEIYYRADDTVDNLPFGFQGSYDEMRTKHDMVCGEFRSTYDYWHLGRQFTKTPTLNDDFMYCKPRKDIFAVPSEPGFLVQYGNIIKALRPLPIIAEPGLIDH